jgi:hypothetical protein
MQTLGQLFEPLYTHSIEVHSNHVNEHLDYGVQQDYL